jgi:hypothetical protein
MRDDPIPSGVDLILFTLPRFPLALSPSLPAPVTTHMTQVRQKIELAIPRKRVGSTSGHDSVSQMGDEQRAD